jgi:hypothetical protein
MAVRIYPWFVLFFWLAMMSWLVASKVVPPLLDGEPPDYHAWLDSPSDSPALVSWRISWNDKRIGTATSKVVQRFGGGMSMRQVVHFERLPLEAMLSEGFGLVGAVLRPLLGSERNLEIDLQLATEMRFDHDRQFQQFQTVIDMGDVKDCLTIQGKVIEHSRIQVTTHWGSGIGGAPQSIRQEIRLPNQALISDGFAPRSELRNLSVGQKWTIPVYRPFPPNSPVQIVQAVAERLEVILWEGREVETIVVVYREDAGSGLHASREPIGCEWVREDGAVLQQELRLSGLKVKFERLTPMMVDAEIEKLDPARHPRLWIR